MSIVRRVIVSVVGLSTLLVGAQAVFASTEAPGLARPQPPAVDAGYELNPAAGEIGDEAVDGDDDTASDHESTVWRSPWAGWLQSARWAKGGPAAAPVIPDRCGATDVIRGPPARG